MNSGNIKRFSAADLAARRARGESQSDLEAVRRKTEADLEADIAADQDFKDVPANWYLSAVAVVPPAKRLLSLRLDNDVVDWFKRQGPGYQTKMNAVLRAFVEHQSAGKKRA